MNLFDLIDVDHVNLKQMMAQLLATGAGDVGLREELRGSFSHDLSIHMEAEEETLYLDLIDVDEFNLAFEALEEHMAMRFHVGTRRDDSARRHALDRDVQGLQRYHEPPSAKRRRCNFSAGAEEIHGRYDAAAGAALHRGEAARDREAGRRGRLIRLGSRL